MDATKPTVPTAKPSAWVGVDVGKNFHWAVTVSAEGEILLSRKVDNEEADLSELIEEALAIGGGELSWAVDQPAGGAALLLTLLWERGHRVLYIPGLAVDRARDGFRGEAKTDRRDAFVIAEQARMRRDLKPLDPSGELLAEMKLLLSRRRDLVADQSRALQRIRDALLALFPGLERTLPDMRYRGALELLCRYQTPTAIRRSGRKRIETYLKGRGARNAARLAEAAVSAAKAQKTASRDSGKRTGNNRRMRGGNRALKRVFYQAAFASLRSSPHSRTFYDRKRAEGKRHNQALIALARRRVNVLWAMLRDGTEFDPTFAT